MDFESISFTSLDTAACAPILPTTGCDWGTASLDWVCGRYTLVDPDPRILRMRFGLNEDAKLACKPRFNIAPTDPVLAVRELAKERQPGDLRWGLIPGKWAFERKGRPLINARAETIANQPAFAASFRQRRCLIPADGFYEWRRDDEGKVPIWFSMPDEAPFAFAGLWAEYHPPGADVITSCTIVTCGPNELMRPIHDRMPVILSRDAESVWLDSRTHPDELVELLAPAPDGVLVAREVGDGVNSVRNDSPELVTPRTVGDRLF